jgi:D-sedoheptulose 7-phosphate isomerase
MAQFEMDAEKQYLLSEDYMSFYQEYISNLQEQLSLIDESLMESMIEQLMKTWEQEKKVFVCGNGGSAANAAHIANDLLYGVNPNGVAVNIEALTTNSAVITCLANDTGYENIFSQQLITKAKQGDVLIAMSGSGNSPNIIKALKQAKIMGVKTYAIVGFSGGKAKELADVVIHAKIEDMQISEDIQVIIGHWLMRRMNQIICESQSSNKQVV